MWKVKSWELWEQCNYGTYLDTITWVKKEDFTEFQILFNIFLYLETPLKYTFLKKESILFIFSKKLDCFVCREIFHVWIGAQ